MKTDAFLFPIRPAIRWAASGGGGGGGGGFRSNERDWLAPNPAAGAWINVYLKTTPQGPIAITIADKAGKVIRTIRQRGEAGMNRFVWNLRYDPSTSSGQAASTSSGQGGRGGGGATPGAQAAEGDTPAGPSTGSGQGGRGGGNQGPAVLPGDYTVTVNVGSQKLSGMVTVALDPGVTVSAADLDAQLQASYAALALQAKTTAIVDRVDSIIAQLTAIDGQLPRQNPPAYATQVKNVLEGLKLLRDNDIARPLPGLGYRQYPRLREDVQSLAGSFGRGFRAPNEGELQRMKDLTARVEEIAAAVNVYITGRIPAINEAMKAAPRIAVDPIK
jgi:hypothetical protein